jgi:DNA-directed RNA polymerase specialized sigma24 family protein
MRTGQDQMGYVLADSATQRAEQMQRVHAGLNGLGPVDRGVLTRREFERFDGAEAAVVLSIPQEAGAKRYLRALKRLKDVLATTAGGGEGL